MSSWILARVATPRNRRTLKGGALIALWLALLLAVCLVNPVLAQGTPEDRRPPHESAGVDF